MTTDPVDLFIARWRDSGAAERSNYQLFLAELCELLDVPRPDPATPDNTNNAYVFERSVARQRADGSVTPNYIDLYKRGCFVLEAKQGVEQEEAAEAFSEAERERRARRKKGTATRGSKGWDEAMLRARGQAEQYARALPAAEGRPPFVLVVDVAHCIEVYSEFTRSGGAYVPYPEPRSHRIGMEALRDERTRATLRAVWTDPLALDPARLSARVTRDIAARLARLAKSLEASGHAAESVATFLMRCLFTMFAEDVRLLPERSFTALLESLTDAPDSFCPVVEELWRNMNSGGFSVALRADLLRFNGGLFAQPAALPLSREQIELLIEAARADWREVEPAIFGTLLERALEPQERHKLGAHYTPRAYVERLVLPTVVEPLREEWTNAQAAALTLYRQGKEQEAATEIRAFHDRLCHVRVLDPACGSGNFLYVTLEHLKRLEGEVLDMLDTLGAGQEMLDMAGSTVDPHQFLGLEINPRAAAIAEMVLWIGYLQWHFRTRGKVAPPTPVLKDFRNIECRDAVLAFDAEELVLDDSGAPVTRWDGRTFKKHSVTGEDVPDDTARTPLYRYTNPRKAEWPEADYVVGNPPFIGNKRMRSALGDGYVETLRATWTDVPDSADYVMYWWHEAAEKVRSGTLRRFGLITTNSLRQSFNRQIIQRHMADKKPLSLVFAIPDHPWVDSADGAAVRISMTVGAAGELPGDLLRVRSEINSEDDGTDVELVARTGKLFPDLSVGADVAGASRLQANTGLSFMGVTLVGEFRVTADEAHALKMLNPASGVLIKPYFNGRDLSQRSQDRFVLDAFGLNADELLARHPEIYQRLAERVQPAREHNKRDSYRKKWWVFGEPRTAMRAALSGLTRYIATLETSKHRFFMFLPVEVVPDHTLFAVATDESAAMGVLSSRVHVQWALAAGSNLGVGNDPRWRNVACFDPFPFPTPTDATAVRIRELAESLDAHRKRQQKAHPGLTLTNMYNVMEKLRQNVPLIAKDKSIHEQGLISVLAQIHDELDAAVLDAYGWNDLAHALVGKPGGTTPLQDKPAEQAEAEEALLERLVALNTERAAEERRGNVRWLRPDFQNPAGTTATQTGIDVHHSESTAVVVEKKLPWPKTLAEQAKALRNALDRSGTVTAEQPSNAPVQTASKSFLKHLPA